VIISSFGSDFSWNEIVPDVIGLIGEGLSILVCFAGVAITIDDDTGCGVAEDAAENATASPSGKLWSNNDRNRRIVSRQERDCLDLYSAVFAASLISE